MFFAILLRTTNLPDSSSKSLDQKILSSNFNKIIVYLPYNNYVLWIISDEDIPESLKEQIKPIEIDTGIEKAVNAFQHYYYLIDNLQNPEEQRKLMSLRSKLTYAVSENLAPDNFYFQLKTPVDNISNRRKFIYVLFYDSIPCYTMQEDPLLDNFQKALQAEMGVLIASTFSLDFPAVPRWYIRETLRDLIELGGFNMTDKFSMVGPNSGEIYLFYREPSNITDDIVNDLSIELHGRIRTAMNLKIFPQNTPNEIIKAKGLVPTAQKQYTLAYTVPDNIPIFAEIMQQTFTLDSLLKLFWFLFWLMISPTYAFIEKELEIFLRPNGIHIRHETKYLADFLRVRSAARVSPYKQLDHVVKLYYPESMDKDALDIQLKGKSYIQFFDSENNQAAIVASDLVGDDELSVVDNIPVIEREYPSIFSLDSRVEHDFDPVKLLSPA